MLGFVFSVIISVSHLVIKTFFKKLPVSIHTFCLERLCRRNRYFYVTEPERYITFKNWLAKTPEFSKDFKMVSYDLPFTEASGRCWEMEGVHSVPGELSSVTVKGGQVIEDRMSSPSGPSEKGPFG